MVEVKDLHVHIDTAIEWHDKGGDLKELALSLFSIEELENRRNTRIRVYGRWMNKEEKELFGPGCILDLDWGPGDEYD